MGWGTHTGPQRKACRADAGTPCIPTLQGRCWVPVWELTVPTTCWSPIPITIHHSLPPTPPFMTRRAAASQPAPSHLYGLLECRPGVGSGRRGVAHGPHSGQTAECKGRRAAPKDTKPGRDQRGEATQRHERRVMIASGNPCACDGVDLQDVPKAQCCLLARHDCQWTSEKLL